MYIKLEDALSIVMKYNPPIDKYFQKEIVECSLLWSKWTQDILKTIE